MAAEGRPSKITLNDVESGLPKDGSWLDGGDNNIAASLAVKIGRKSRHGTAVKIRLSELARQKRVELRTRQLRRSSHPNDYVITGARRLLAK